MVNRKGSRSTWTRQVVMTGKGIEQRRRTLGGNED